MSSPSGELLGIVPPSATANVRPLFRLFAAEVLSKNKQKNGPSDWPRNRALPCLAHLPVKILELLRGPVDPLTMEFRCKFRGLARESFILEDSSSRVSWQAN